MVVVTRVFRKAVKKVSDTTKVIVILFTLVKPALNYRKNQSHRRLIQPRSNMFLEQIIDTRRDI